MFKCFLQTKCEKALFSGNKTFHLNSIEQVIKFLAYTSTRTIIVKIKPSEFLKIQASHSSAIKINSHRRILVLNSKKYHKQKLKLIIFESPQELGM